ncbi:TetR/AcrR family transcriptional regulator [Nonomuraea sp. PA05]|uniref:TetR/AcrR family transcriptional regulator n=1 Tax=Nonomuraea sp. PA05 TaxID=2604466 RepID=UPI0011DA646D|nr:TetR family transcriptional regulator [Nonomuraea sp. PA05]TYB56145.1 TetR/AcrR family transcriptional regulator [Nonomuraea sp. PA05]
MTPPRVAAPVGARSLIMDTAERLYATRGLAAVSLRQIGEAAGQRNKSAVQYHFSGRDDLIKAILAEHAEAIERHRLAMTARHGDPERMPLPERIGCIVLPRIEHHIDLGTPSWYGRFLAQVTVEPALREYAVRAHLDTPSLRRLHDAGAAPGPGAARRKDMTRQLIVHMSAELETELAREQPDPGDAAAAWRRLGADLVTAVSELVGALGGTDGGR